MNVKKCFTVVLVLFAACLGFSQDAKEKKFIKRVAKEACKCLDEIPATLGKEEVLEKINSCITLAIIAQQTTADSAEMKEMKKLIDQALEAKEGTSVGDGKTFTIYADKNFREIQDYMMENCEKMKPLVASNDMLSDKSMSKNPVALKYYHEGEDYYAKEKYEKAVVSYKKALETDAFFAFAWDNLGLAYRKLLNFDEALKCYKKSLEIDPYGTMPLQNMAVVYHLKQDFKSAGETYLRLIDIEPENPEGYYGAGRAFYAANDYEKACDYMFKAYIKYSETRSPYLKDAESNLSMFYQDLKQKGKLDIIRDAAKKNNINLE